MGLDSKRISQAEYDAAFNDDVHGKALSQAYEIRKFEIELYWKRASYFWTFIGAAFVAYAAFFNAEVSSPVDDGRTYILVLIACIGLVFSVAWHCVNKGSKFWQENWENHVELLEDKVSGPLYKTVTQRPEKYLSPGKSIKAFFVAPKPFSVSKINQLVSTYIAVVWVLILYWSTGGVCLASCGCRIDWNITILVTLTIMTCTSFWVIGKSNQGKHHPTAFTRNTKINES